MRRNNPNVIPRDGDYDGEEDRPHDERFSQSAMDRDERSNVSQNTYQMKESTAHGRSTISKRTAQKAPSTEPYPKLSSFRSFPDELPPPSSSPLDNLRQFNDHGSAIGGQELFLGPPQDGVFPTTSLRQPSNQQLQPPRSKPPGFDSTSSTNSGTTSGKYDDPPTNDILSNVLEGMSLGFASHTNISSLQGEPTTVSSLTGPSGIVSTLGDNSVDTSTSNISSRSGNPRSILNERYQKKHSISFTKKDFVSIRDASNGDHNPMFTSTFICPVSGECFLSGELVSSDSGIFVLQQNGTNWYMKKSIAEFAAAGRAEDCFRFRSGESSRNGILEQFCADHPFLKRSKSEEQENISTFLESRACDANARDNITALMKKRTEK